jgi:hypothetical protein
VTHVRAVGKVVRAELPDEELVEERCLVAGSAGRVEDRLVGRSQCLQLVGDNRERVGPLDRLVVCRPRTEDHRLSDPSQLAQPVVRLLGQLGNAVASKELRCGTSGRRFPRNCLCPVLTELDRAAGSVRIRPRTRLTIESALLIDRAQGAQRAADTHLVVGSAERGENAWDSACILLRRSDADCLHRFVSRQRAHATIRHRASRRLAVRARFASPVRFGQDRLLDRIVVAWLNSIGPVCRRELGRWAGRGLSLLFVRHASFARQS